MRLDFNVLWVEDQPDRIQAQRTRMDRAIANEGFRMKTKIVNSVNEASDCLSDDMFGDHVDIVLMDFDLGAGPTGAEGLKVVRKTFPYKDIIFYSAGASDLQKKVQDSGLQGIFWSSREDLPRTFKGVFEALVKKVVDIDHARGIVMGATSQIDAIILECLTMAYDNEDAVGQAETLTLIHRKIPKIVKEFGTKAKKAAAIDSIDQLAAAHAVFTSIHRLQLLKKTTACPKKQIDVSGLVDEYSDEVIPRRNDLAHVNVKVEGFSRRLYDRNNVEISSETVRDLRRKLADHQERFESLKANLTTP
jgi:hypothetical protein